MLLRPVRVPVPEGLSLPVECRRSVARSRTAGTRAPGWRWPSCSTAYLGSGLPGGTMGRSFEEDRDFFLAGLAGGALLAQLISEKER